MKKLGIFGGSFNPVHNGHLGLVTAAAKLYMLDQVLLMPCRIPPHKAADDLAPQADRLEMCRLSCEGQALIQASDLEYHLPEPSYTYDTICRLKELYPDSALYLIIGADMLLTFDKWYKWQELGSMVTILAGARLYGQSKDLEAKARELNHHGLKVEIFHVDIIELASTDIRLLLQQNKDISAFVPKLVKEYIINNGLYAKPEETV